GDLLNLDLDKLFYEYPNKNIAIAIIENNKLNQQKIYLKSRIQEKKISKSFRFFSVLVSFPLREGR
ncbi:MAG: hypothetical protein VXY41_02355, partial [Pseudomonadota bacterium]|nr:hypothetical protein [Pseudomonadota bacterium]